MLCVGQLSKNKQYRVKKELNPEDDFEITQSEEELEDDVEEEEDEVEEDFSEDDEPD